MHACWSSKFRLRRGIAPDPRNKNKTTLNRIIQKREKDMKSYLCIMHVRVKSRELLSFDMCRKRTLYICHKKKKNSEIDIASKALDGDKDAGTYWGK